MHAFRQHRLIIDRKFVVGMSALDVELILLVLKGDQSFNCEFYDDRLKMT